MPSGVQTEVKTYQMFINGEWVASRSAKKFPVYDPSTEEVIAQVPDANADDVNRAVAAARAAFDEGPWASTTAQERGRVLFRLAEKVRQNIPALADLECRNTGKPIVEAEYDINDVATCFEYYGGLATKIIGTVNPVPDNAMSLSLKETRWRRWADYSVELSAAHGGMEARTRAGCGMHQRAETRRANAADRARTRQVLRRLRTACGRCEHRYRLRRNLRLAIGSASRRQ